MGVTARYVLFELTLCRTLRSLQTDQYIALSKKDLQISITLNELYNTQSLLVQHLDILVRFFS